MAPLSGYRILDLTLLLPGPLATQILRDMGASVTKIEPPGRGDLMQYWPPLVGDVSAIYLALNRGKETVSIDLKDTLGRVQFESMVKEADVVVEGFRPGVLERLGVGYERLSELNPRVVLCSITGYGQSGPYQQRAGHDIGYQALAGVLSLAGGAGGGDRAGAGGGGRFFNPQLQVADTAAGAYAAAMLVLAALLERQQTGRGRHLDVSMSEQLLPMMTASFASASVTQCNPIRDGETLTGGAPCYRIYQTRDGHGITIGALEPKFWKAAVNCLAIPDLEAFDMESAPYLGGEGSEEVAAWLSSVFALKTRQQWDEVFRSVDACVEPVLSLTEVVQHPQWLSRSSFASYTPSKGPSLHLPKMPASLAGFDTEENRS